MVERTGLHPHSDQLMQLLAYVYLDNHRPEKAAVLLQGLEALGQMDEQALALLALAQQRAGQSEQALQTLGRMPASAAEGPLGAVMQLIRAQALHALGFRNEAAEAMQAYTRLRASHPGPDDGGTR